MPPEVAIISATSPPNSLGSRAISGRTSEGALLHMMVSVGSRLLVLATQVLLARFLLNPDDFGRIAKALFVFTIVSQVSSISLGSFLIYRHRRFHLYAPAAFWLGVGLSLINGVLLVIAAPVAAALYEQPQMFSPVLASALVPVAGVFSVVPLAWMSSRLDFRGIALANFLGAVAGFLATLATAALGGGSSSWFFGLAMANIALSIVALWRTKGTFVTIPNRRAMRVILTRSGGWLFACAILNALQAQGDILVLSLFLDDLSIGLYFIGYQLARQSGVLLGAAITAVMQPTLAIVRERAGQVRALFRSAEMLSVVSSPASLAAVLILPAVVQWMHGAKYVGAVPLAQVLCLGMPSIVASGPAVSLINAQGRFRYLFIHTLIVVTSFLLALAIGATSGAKALGVAWSVTIFNVLFGPIGFALAVDGLKLKRETLLAAFKVLLTPLLVCLPALWIALVVSRRLGGDESSGARLVALVATLAVYAAIVLPSLLLVFGKRIHDLRRLLITAISALPFKRRQLHS